MIEHIVVSSFVVLEDGYEVAVVVVFAVVRVGAEGQASVALSEVTS